jgi:hypothetical protein
MSDQTQARIEAESQGTTVLPVDVILPDPGQPRRLLPEDLAQAVTNGTLSRVEVIREWQRRDKTLPLHNLRELARLADSIAQHGLINPISVRQPRPHETVPPGVKYLIITGERRYWAQIYLLAEGRQIQEGETLVDPSLIKTTVAAAGVTVRAHQLIENLLREDINAVERARGMWGLRYELSGLDYQSSSSAESEEEDNGNYSSPPVESDELVPWARVEEMLGISRRYRLFVVSVLNLSEAAQELVASHNLAEMTIRPIVQKLRDKPDLQLEALRQVIIWQKENEANQGPEQGIVAAVKELVERLLAPEGQPRVTRSVSSTPVVRFRSKVRQTLDFLNRLRPEDRAGLPQVLSREEFADVMIDLRNLRQQIDKLLTQADEADPPADQPAPLPDAEEPSSGSEPGQD